MNGKGMKGIVVMAAAILFSVVLAGNNAFAHEGGKSCDEGKEHCHGHHHHHHGRFGHDPLMRIIHKLDLTDAQKQQVAGILKGEQAQAKTIATGQREARAKLFQAVLSGQDVTAAAAEAANFSKQSAAMRSAIMAKIIPILTPEQKTVLQKMQEKIQAWHSKAGTEGRQAEKWDRYIEKHGK